ncbi:MAG TPA: type II secretion system F family protein, partial [Candidatus Binataceae bacterium]|nr:type II secretion system F family protein [Candidatus Binataceae bacterium]
MFAYRGLATDGRSVAGVIDADNPRGARGKLRDLGIFPTEVAEEESAPALRTRPLRQWLPGIRRRIPAPELSLLTRQLSSLLGAGVQLVEALGALGGQSSRQVTKKTLSQVRESVREGSSLADALAAHPDIFSDLYIGMVRAGEAAGALEGVLDRLADYNERQLAFVSKVRGALTYPAIMMCVGGLIISFLVAYVVPQVATIFQEQHAVLPLMTRALIALSSFLTTYWLFLLIGVIAAVSGIIAGLSTKAG